MSITCSSNCKVLNLGLFLNVEPGVEVGLALSAQFKVGFSCKWSNIGGTIDFVNPSMSKSRATGMWRLLASLWFPSLK